MLGCMFMPPMERPVFQWHTSWKVWSMMADDNRFSNWQQHHFGWRRSPQEIRSVILWKPCELLAPSLIVKSHQCQLCTWSFNRSLSSCQREVNIPVVPGEENEAPSLGIVYQPGKRRTEIQVSSALNNFFYCFYHMASHVYKKIIMLNHNWYNFGSGMFASWMTYTQPFNNNKTIWKTDCFRDQQTVTC